MNASIRSQECRQALNCPATVHAQTCPWHPDNVTIMRLNARDFDALLADLDAPPKDLPRLRAAMRSAATPALSPDEFREVLRLVALHRPEARITFHNRAAALHMRYNIDRWQAILGEVSRRVATESEE